MKQFTKKIMNFTHGDLDGLGCNFLIELKHPTTKVIGVHCNYDNINSNVRKFIRSDEINTVEKVYITDISITRELCDEIVSRGLEHKVQIIDHHINKSTEHLNDYNFAILQGKKEDGTLCSGTWLVAKHLEMFDTSDFLDDFINLVDDYDTWNWEVKNNIMSKVLNRLNSILGREKLKEELYNQYYSSNKCFIVSPTLSYILDIDDDKYRRVLDLANKYIQKTKYKEFNVGIVLADEYKSELGNDLCKLHTDLDFVMLVSLTSGISLRTKRDDIHLGEIAREIGAKNNLKGSGHAKASGVTIDNTYRENFLLSFLK